MNLIDKYFRSKTNKLSYIELKENLDIYEEMGIKDIPLPIILDDMMEGISSNDFENEIKIEYIIDGILLNIAIDNEFLYINEYKEILNNLIKNPSQYALSRSIKSNEKDRAILFSRASFLLDEKNELAAYNYARFLWNLDIDEKQRPIFVEESVRILERILNYNDENPLANYELGNINTAMGDYIKANSFYNRALRASQNEELIDEIRDRINKIAPDVAVANSIYYINRMNYSTAITELMDARKNSNRYDIPYYIAISYMNQEKYEMAEQFFEEAIDKGADFATLYTDYVYIKYILSKDYEAIEIANKAIEKYPTEIKLRYNRAVINVAHKRYDKANEDFDFILEYQDLSDEMFNQIMKIKETMID